MTHARLADAVVFLVCVEPGGRGSAPSLLDRLAAWHARPCMEHCWTIAANTTSRIVYDSLADTLADDDRLLVCELGDDTLWYNLRDEQPALDRAIRRG